MPEYVDGFVLPVPKKNLPAYCRMARVAAKVWREHGAVAYRECAGDDLKSHFSATFQRQLKLKRGETVVLAWIVFKSRAHRDRVNAKAMKDPRMDSMCNMGPMPFNPKRMLYGGFKTIVRA
jgi:uncharacterized protein YbaA (DUF1428 family)